MKKRTKLIIGLSLVLAMIIGGATMAWFTSNPAQVTNTFKAGTVTVTLNDYTGTSVTTPFAAITNVNPGDWYDKKVSVTSNGSKQAYVRVKLTPAWSDAELSTDNVILNLGTDWVLSEGYYYYKHILNEGETTTLLLNGVTFDGVKTTNSYQSASFTIDVQAEAVQASHYAFRDVWGLGSNAAVPAAGIDAWAPANEAPTASN